MTDDEAMELGGRIGEFLNSTGGAYANLPAATVWNIGFALATGQYVMKEVEGRLVYFAAYWLVHPEDVESVTERVRPLDLVHGSVMYVTEAANVGGRRGMAEMIRALREQAPHVQGVFWHRPVKGDRVYNFPSQKGGSHGIERHD